MTKKKSPEERRGELAKAALKLFRRKGFSETTVSEIVNEAGVAQGTFYLYFGSKDDILAEIARGVAKERCKAIEQIARMDDVGAVKKMRLILEALVELGSEDRGWVVEYHEPRFRQLHEQLANRTLGEFHPFITEVIEQGVSEGVYSSKYPAADAAFILYAGTIDNPAVLERSGLSKEQWVKAYQDFVLKVLEVID